MTRQQERKVLRLTAKVTVNERYPNEPRRARRKIAKALAKRVQTEKIWPAG